MNLEIEEENEGINDRRGAITSLLQADRVVQQIEINYASQSTQVDIQKLKVGFSPIHPHHLHPHPCHHYYHYHPCHDHYL